MDDDEFNQDFNEGEGYDEIDDELTRDDESDTEDADIALEFAGEDDNWLPWSECVARTVDALGNYSFEEIIDMNSMDKDEALALLFEGGNIGLPIELTDEEVSDLPPEEDETQE